MSKSCRTFRPNRTNLVVIRSLGALLGVLALLLPFGLWGVVTGHVGAGAFLSFLGLVALIGAWACWSATRRPGAPLTLRICGDSMTMSRKGQVTDTVTRAEVGLVVLKSGERGGVPRINVFGPSGELVGRWDTNWLKGPIRIMRALKSAGYPYVLDQVTGPGVGKPIRSFNAPTWTDEVRQS